MSSELATPVQLDFEQIKQIIPQRFPFLMLDRVVDIEPGVRVVGIKNLTGNEWFYQGHFPKKAITPGAMLCEAMAQTGIIFFHMQRSQRSNREDVTYLLGSIRVRFIRPAWPGDQLRVTVTPVKLTSQSGILNGEISANGKLVAKSEFVLTMKENRQL